MRSFYLQLFAMFNVKMYRFSHKSAAPVINHDKAKIHGIREFREFVI